MSYGNGGPGAGCYALRAEIAVAGERHRHHPVRPPRDSKRVPRPAGPSLEHFERPPVPPDPPNESPEGVPSDAAADIAQIVAEAQAGSAEAFGLLYDRYVETVYRYLYYRVGNAATAEDLVSETFLRALRRIDTFSWQGRDMAAWFVTIARNLLADERKSSRYRLEVPTDDLTNATRGQVTESPEEQVLQSMSNEALLKAVRSLRPDQQECLALRFLQGMSVSETAEIMGRNEGAVKALQYRAVRTLAKRLPKEGLT